MASFSGLVLAGGKSSRMGKDKAQLTLQGERLTERISRLLYNAGAGEVLVNRNQPGFLNDIVPGKGPLSGIHSALNVTDTPLLVVPVDMPLLSVESLARLAQQGLQHSTPTVFTDHQLPVFIPSPSEMRRTLRAILSGSGPYSLRSLYQTTGIHNLSQPSLVELENINYPNQWRVVRTALDSFSSSSNEFYPEAGHGAFS